MAKHYLSEVGTEFILDTGVVIGSATAQYIKTLNPNSLEGTLTASLYSSYSELAKLTGTYLLKHTMAVTDITVSGEWRFQAFVGTASGTWYGETVKVTFYDEFE